MRIYAQGRQTGKTTKLVKMSAETGAIIVCPNHHMAHYTESFAQNLGLGIPTPITVYQFIKDMTNCCWEKNQKYLIDELQMILRSMNVEAATVDKDVVLVYPSDLVDSINAVGNVYPIFPDELSKR